MSALSVELTDGVAVVTFLLAWRFHLFFAIVTDTVVTGLVGLLITTATYTLLTRSRDTSQKK